MVKPDSLLALRYIRDAQLSPDGQWAAYIVSRTTADTEFSELWLQNVDSDERSRVGDGTGYAMAPRWSPDGDTLAFILDGGLRLLTRATGEIATVKPAGWGAASPPAWSPDGKSIAVCTLRQRPHGPIRHITRRQFRMEGLGFIEDFDHALCVVDVKSGEERVLADKGGPYSRPRFSPDGKRVLFMAAPLQNPGFSPFLYTVPANGGEHTCIAGDGWYIGAAEWAPDGKRIVIMGDYQSTITVPVGKLWIVNADGSNPQLRTPGLMGHVGLRAHFDMPIWGIDGESLAFVGDDAFICIQSKGRCGIYRVALTGAPRWDEIVGGDRTCILTSARKRLLFATTDLMHPTELAVADLNGANERQLTDLNSAAMADWPELKYEHLEMASNDGLKFEGWCVTRKDLSGPQPTVLYIHGGPFLGQGHYFRFDTHMLAANGISVLFSNFRGSAGYGEAFCEAVVGDWGARGYPDHMATVDAAIGKGLADPKNLGVWGHSHGGFATCWIVGHTNRFVAAVAEAPVTSYLTTYYLCDMPDGFTREFGGAKPFDLPDVYRSRSPLSYAWRCKTPTRLIHGDKDTRCTMAESEQFYRALDDAGCETDIVVLHGCDHLGDASGPVPGRVAQNDALLGWFVRWLTPGRAA